MKIPTFIKNVLAGMTALALFLSPALSFAKENDQGNGKNAEVRALKEQIKVIKESEKEFRKIEKLEAKRLSDDSDDDEGDDNNRQKGKNKCFKAFGHLIAPGWIKNNGIIDWKDFSENCFLPFGIAKKIGDRGYTGTTTPDTIAPIISSITTRKSATQALIRWNTNEPSDSTVFYATNSGFTNDATTTKKLYDNDLEYFHRLVLTGLTASTTYYAKVMSKDNLGNGTTSNEFSFKTTSGAPVVLDTVAPVIENIVGDVDKNSIAVSWNTNESATGKVYYSTSTPVDTGSLATPFVFNSTLKTNHLVSIGGLTGGTLYYLIVESVDASGNIATSTMFSTTTESTI